eukprot:CAMPEP_0117082208 /NCGR_PEP_ID=MMETSP0472-20121206/57901_1 /TAXON_ID=693140 ORGANISM="Tiarina fusus, Strain LIS" /NCGR_SAMPLE_ID=MMETSP0472 /ASSEMBLY_ACC=CAM_ASM_000603 /LENGTH=718 /DNA_ID=CAMNT_0004810373 /DNA_START=434 /DNA_END=2587 /DNA_ORIENTATION=-
MIIIASPNVASNKKGFQTQYSIVVTEYPLNDQCDDSIILTDISAESGFTIGATAQRSLCSTSLSTGPMVYYSISSPTPATLQISCTADFNTELHLFPDCSMDSCLAYIPTGCQGNPSVDIPAGDLILAVSGSNFSDGSFFDLAISLYFNDMCETAEELFPFVEVTGTTVNSRSSWSDLISCGTPLVDSPVVFYTYTTIYDRGDLTISTCSEETTTDTFINIFAGNCNNLNCLSENDNSCGLNAKATLDAENRLPIETTIIIAVHSPNNNEISNFSIIVEETEIIYPENGNCQAAKEIFNQVLEIGSSVNSETLRFMLPNCPSQDFSGNNSPVVFYFYDTQFNYGELVVDTCSLQKFDTVISLFVSDCSECIASNDNVCGTSSLISLPYPLRQLKGTTITIAVHGIDSDSDGGSFALHVQEIGHVEPSNINCHNAIELHEGITQGTTLGSPFLSTQIPICGTNDENFGSPSVFYNYISTQENSVIRFDTCFGGSFDSYLRVYSGDCDEMECIAFNDNSCGLLSSVEISGFPIGSHFLIVVSAPEFSAGNFVLRASEELICDPDGPKYECGTSKTLVTNQIRDGVQFVVLEDLDLGFCYDEEGCSCDIQREESKGDLIEVGDELVSGVYEVYTIAVNDLGFSSDECSFRVNVENQCNPDGPQLRVPDKTVVLSTRSSCTFEGQKCAIMPAVFLGTCSDYEGCTCEVNQVDGPQAGALLIP